MWLWCAMGIDSGRRVVESRTLHTALLLMVATTKFWVIHLPVFVRSLCFTENRCSFLDVGNGKQLHKRARTPDESGPWGKTKVRQSRKYGNLSKLNLSSPTSNTIFRTFQCNSIQTQFVCGVYADNMQSTHSMYFASVRSKFKLCSIRYRFPGNVNKMHAYTHTISYINENLFTANRESN